MLNDNHHIKVAGVFLISPVLEFSLISSDSLALREFLGLGLEDRTPDHSSLTIIRQRLPLEVHEEVFAAMMTGEAELRDAGVDADHLRAQASRELPRLRSVAKDVFARWAKLL